MLETDLNAVTDTYTRPEAEEKMKTEQFGHVSDYEIQCLIDSQTNSNIRKNTKWVIETFNK
jgi:hypothetical protein